jgi:preprotein translocase subunit SecF
MQFIKPDININFMGRRNLFLAVSGLLMLISIVAILVRGINYGIDFSGGLLVQVKFEQAVSAEDIRSALHPLGLDDAMVQSFGQEDENEFMIRSLSSGLTLEQADETIKESLQKSFADNKVQTRRTETVGPKAGRDLREKAMMAMFFSILLMGIYISGRFESKWGLSCLMAAALGITAFILRLILLNLGIPEEVALAILTLAVIGVTFLICLFLHLRYATGAVVSIIHDALLTIGIYCILGREFNLSTVAAILTIIGFSVNDTIIIYDRVRENLRKNLRRSFEETINLSINQTLSRTILTSGTLLAVVIILFFFGGGVIEDFALTMIIGVVVATYSSIYIASPLILIMPERGKKLLLSPAGKTARPVKSEEAALPLKSAAAEPAETKESPGQAKSGAGKASASRKKHGKPAHARSRRR